MPRTSARCAPRSSSCRSPNSRHPCTTTSLLRIHRCQRPWAPPLPTTQGSHCRSPRKPRHNPA
eukprot:11228049-Lingulodinium_polyedra.AAC.1